MKVFKKLSIPLVLLMLLGLVGAQSPAQVTAQPPQKIVVFELFTSDGWGACTSAGLAVDQLADDYSDKPVFFVEWGTNYNPNNRYSLLYESGGGRYIPEMMVDSSRIWKTGVTYESAKSYTDDALARPAKGVLDGSVSITGRIATLTVSVTNNSGITLNAANKAAVHGIVFENAKVHKTHRVGRQSAKVNISDLPNGQTQTFTLTLDLSTVSNMKNITFVALVDYKAATKTGGLYDQIQAI